MKFVELSEPEFKAFEQKNKYGNFFQTIERSHVRKKMGYDVELLGVKDGKKILAAMLVVGRNGEMMIQVGPIMDWENLELVDFCIKNLKKHAEEKKYARLEVFPPVLYSKRDDHGKVLEKYDTDGLFECFKQNGFSHEGFSEKTELKSLRWMYIKDLTGMESVYDGEMSIEKTRRKVLRRTRNQLDVIVLKDRSKLEEWRQGLLGSNERNNLLTRPLSYFEYIWDEFGDKAYFVEARRKDNGELAYSELNILHPNEMVGFLGGSVEKNRKFNGPTALKGWQIEECLKQGITRLNFYGFDGIFTPENNLLEFKRSFQGYIEEYVGGFDLVLNKTALLKNKVVRRLGRFKKK